MIVEDDRAFRKSIRHLLQPSGQILDCAHPDALLDIPDPALLTHALIDLSYGTFDPQRKTPRSNGLDAMVLLEEIAPSCPRVAMSVLTDGAYYEVGRAVMQFWPDTPMLSKLDFDHFASSLSGFVTRGHTPSHPAGAMALADLNTMVDWRTRIPDLMSGSAVGNPYRLVWALASFPRQPTNAEIAQRLGVNPSGISVRLSDLRQRFEPYLTAPDLQKGAALWQWVSPRYALFAAVDPARVPREPREPTADPTAS